MCHEAFGVSRLVFSFLVVAVSILHIGQKWLSLQMLLFFWPSLMI